MSSRTLNIVLPDDLVKQADKVAKAEFKNRSELIREALFAYVEKKQARDRLKKLGAEYRRRYGTKTEEEVAQIVHDFREGR